LTADSKAFPSRAREGVPSRIARILGSIAVAPILVYQRVISPAIPQRCKYEPTCSRYAVHAIRRHGLLRGGILAGWRLLRCNPFSYGGYDPVDAQRVFRSDHHTGGR
jgi:putative membrane protein insertion efficiency factor